MTEVPTREDCELSECHCEEGTCLADEADEDAEAAAYDRAESRRKGDWA